MLPTYDPFNWHWIVADDQHRAWSSAAGAYVTTWPNDAVTRIGSEEELAAVLHMCGLPGPTAVVPQSVTMAQCRVALRRAGLLDRVSAAVAATGGEVQDAWEYSHVVRRDSALVASLGKQLALSDADIDALFLSAVKIEF